MNIKRFPSWTVLAIALPCLGMDDKANLFGEDLDVRSPFAEWDSESDDKRHSQSTKAVQSLPSLSEEDLKNLAASASPLRDREVIEIDQDRDVIYLKKVDDSKQPPNRRNN